jgi:hypothetical protein
MIGTGRRVGSLRLFALALGMFAAPAFQASAHEVYPPGWNKPSTPGPVVYEFDAVALEMHRVPGVEPLKPDYRHVIYQWVPGGNHLRRIP